MNDRGFTLIEMLVGLSIFALLASAGVGLLSASADTQQAVERSLSEQAAIERIHLLLQSDLAQVADRSSTALDGQVRPAFTGTANSMQFVRGGVVALDPDPRSDLRRVGWLVIGSDLVRVTYERVDGGEDRLPDAVLLDRLSGFELAYRNISGDWVDAWPDASGEPLPRAVRLTATASRVPQTRFVVALPRLSSGQAQEATR